MRKRQPGQRRLQRLRQQAKWHDQPGQQAHQHVQRPGHLKVQGGEKRQGADKHLQFEQNEKAGRGGQAKYQRIGWQIIAQPATEQRKQHDARPGVKQGPGCRLPQRLGQHPAADVERPEQQQGDIALGDQRSHADIGALMKNHPQQPAQRIIQRQSLQRQIRR